MLGNQCIDSVCFVPLYGPNPALFGFSTYLAGLALMVLAWTNADVRYRFRIQTAPIPLKTITFWTISWIGVFTLLTDVWFVEHWLIPDGKLITPAIWQALLGILFLTLFLVWTWYAFISPPKYSKLNAKRFAQEIYRLILRGSQDELAIIADELQDSLASIIFHTKNLTDSDISWVPKESLETNPANPEYILELMADRRFCRAIIASSPITGLKLFEEMQKQDKYKIKAESFGRNFINEAISNRDSFLFQETQDYTAGLCLFKPYSQTIFGNYFLVEEIGTLLDVDSDKRKNWDYEQWKVYFEMFLIALKDYVEIDIEYNSRVLCKGLRTSEDALYNLSSIDKLIDTSKNLELQKLKVTIDFIEKAIEILETKACSKWYQRRPDYHGQESFYDSLADFIYEVIHITSHVRAPQALSLLIQYDAVWGRLFSFSTNKIAPVRKYIRRRVYRYLYDEIRQLRLFGYSYTGFSILGFCLNVMELETELNIDFNSFYKCIDRHKWSFRKVVLGWTKKYYAQLYSKYPIPADRCLPDGIRYDKENFKLLKIRHTKYEATAELEYLQLQPYYEQILT